MNDRATADRPQAGCDLRSVPPSRKANEDGDEGMKYFAVTRERGPAWDGSLSMREQKRWTDHAAFMDRLADEGFVILGGPLGDGERHFLLIFNADSVKTIETRLAADPWTPMGMLRIAKIEPWEIMLQKIG